MSRQPKWIDAVKMSRRLRIETGEELARMSPEERIRYLNDFARRHPIMGKKMKSASSGPERMES